MPWQPKDATRFTTKATTAKLRTYWAGVANGALSRCIADGGDDKDCEASAIKIANGRVAQRVARQEKQRQSAANEPGTDPMNDTQKTEQLVEALDQAWGAVQVADGGLLTNVALLGPKSKNGYTYTTDAMLAAVPLYEGRPVYIDHPPDDEPTRRSVRDYAGKIVSARLVEGRIRGDLELVGDNKGWLTELAASRPTDVGMSHVVLARRSKDGLTVESIERVLSVDVVACPATVSLAESQRSTDTQPDTDESDEDRSHTSEEDMELKEALQELATAKVAAEKAGSEKTEIQALADTLTRERDELKAQHETVVAERDKLAADLEAVTKERDEAKDRIDTFEAAEAMSKRRAEIGDLVKEAKLPEAIRPKPERVERWLKASATDEDIKSDLAELAEAANLRLDVYVPPRADPDKSMSTEEAQAGVLAAIRG